jgi:hypothetical protein
VQDHQNHVPPAPKRVAWNKGKLIGAKPPLRPKHVWSIRTKLQIQGRTRDLAMFNLAVDRKLRGCEVVALKVEDIAPHGYAVDRATIRQKKTGLPVRFEIAEHTARQSTTTSAPPVEKRETSCSATAADEAGALQHGNTPVWLPGGSRALALIPAGSARIHCAEPRPR